MMFYKKQGFPEESELVLCTVKKILDHSVFVGLDEYNNLEGMIHISEVSPGRIRNIRDHFIAVLFIYQHFIYSEHCGPRVLE